ncbi:hypothetical protein BDV95DRAFT_600912 [Massariosphaeria phaeospora]|uniref:Uncharacterized protein n=1 Tax=Massariosphaeria phaeospora TaxID=100035 RepID=A0A7C8MPB1_9PLEO|nr:hypothetical protein BDV95DRAFT_600912 [Massariosphaeria phaeospora]
MHFMHTSLLLASLAALSVEAPAPAPVTPEVADKKPGLGYNWYGRYNPYEKYGAAVEAKAAAVAAAKKHTEDTKRDLSGFTYKHYSTYLPYSAAVETQIEKESMVGNMNKNGDGDPDAKNPDSTNDIARPTIHTIAKDNDNDPSATHPKPATHTPLPKRQPSHKIAHMDDGPPGHDDDCAANTMDNDTVPRRKRRPSHKIGQVFDDDDNEGVEDDDDDDDGHGCAV